MYIMKVIVLVIVVLSVCDCSFEKEENEENETFYDEHMERVSVINYPCREPQPRVLYLSEMLENEDLEFYLRNVEDIFPYSTVLHRCEATGCCLNVNQRCRAKTTENVPLTFRVFSERINEFRSYIAVNHTSCNCQSVA